MRILPREPNDLHPHSQRGPSIKSEVTKVNTHQHDRNEKDHIHHRRPRPIQPRKERKREHDREHAREPIRVARALRGRNVPERGADESAGEGTEDTGYEAERGVATEAGESELAHEAVVGMWEEK